MKKILYAMLLVLLTIGIVSCSENSTINDLPAIESVDNFADYDELETYLNSFFKESSHGYVLRNGLTFFSAEMSVGSVMMKDADYMMSESTTLTTSSSHSQTNTQVEGVDESDTVITDGQYIYIVSMDRFVLIDASTLEIIYTYSQANLSLSNLYLVDDHVVLMGSLYTSYEDEKVQDDYYYRYHYAYGVKIVVLDLTDKEDVSVSKEVYFDQSYLETSRMIDGNLYLVMNNYHINYGYEEGNFVPVFADSASGLVETKIPADSIYYMPNDNYSLTYLLIASFNVLEDEPIEIDAYIGSTYQIYMSLNNLYTVVYRHKLNEITGYYDFTTYILRFEIQEGKLVYQAMGAVLGSPLNQFSMDEFEGTFRIATTNYDWQNANGSITNQLYILSATSTDEMTFISSLEGLGKPNERIYAVRFTGDVAYVVTFVNTDPLYKLDLSDIYHPVILGELYEDGVSDYLHPMNDDLMIGVGRTAVTEGGRTYFTGIKISLYDTTGDAPISLDTYFAEGEYSYSPVTYDHKMFVYYQPEGADYWLVAIPVFEYGNTDNPYGFYYEENLYVFKITFAGDLELMSKIPVNNQGSSYDYYYDYLLRGLFIGDFVYTISYHRISMFDITDEFTYLRSVTYAPIN
jgi:inhibitor of cysteine peptidase